MSTYNQSYCNTTTDLNMIIDLQAYDRKTPLSNWAVESTNVWRAESSGNVSVLFENGTDLGSPVANKAAVDSGTDWYYDSSADVCYFYSTTDPNEDLMEAGEDWATLRQRVVDEQSERIRSYVTRPIFPRKGTGQQSASSRDWDWIIIHANRVLAAAELVRPYEFERAVELEKSIIDPETGSGLLDRLNAGDYNLWNEVGNAEREGRLSEVSVNASSTGGILDVRGIPTVSWDVVKIIIDGAGTITEGSASSVTYSTYIRDDTGTKTVQSVSSETIDLGYQSIGRGMMVRFAPGIYTLNDEWQVEVSGLAVDHPTIGSIQMVRS